LAAAAVSTSDGAVDVRGVDGALVVDTGGGELFVDRVPAAIARSLPGAATSKSGWWRDRFEVPSGATHHVGTVRGEAVLATEGGDIMATVSGDARCAHKTRRRGSSHVVKAGAP